MPFTRRSVLSLFLRSLLVQGSWNYQTLIGTGFAYMILPVLRARYGSDGEAMRAALERHTEVFNSHPYLATVAAGAVVRLEEDGADDLLIRRFKRALRGSLGALGDQVIWVSWRPASALLAIALLLIGAPWWVALVTFLLVYNVLHLGVRAWGLRTGLRDGLEVGRSLRAPAFTAWGARAADAGAALAGFCSMLAFAMFASGPGEIGVTALAIVAGALLGPRVRTAVFVALALVWGAGIIARGIL